MICASKSSVCWFVAQNQAGFSLSVASQNRRGEVGVGHMLRSCGLLCVKVCRARIFQFCLNTGGCMKTGGACDTNVNVASRTSQKRTGYCSHLVFCLGL
jgi:hypothetical protein